MAVRSYSQLRNHIGHEIDCIAYGKQGRPPDNVAVECITCNEVLMEFDRDSGESLACPVCGLDMDLVELDEDDEYWSCRKCAKVDVHRRLE